LQDQQACSPLSGSFAFSSSACNIGSPDFRKLSNEPPPRLTRGIRNRPCLIPDSRFVGGVISATPGARYLVDIAVGDIGTGAGTRKYELTIRPDAKSKDTQVEELNVSKNGEHLLAIVDAKSQFVSVTVKAFKPGSTERDNFVFHSAEISRLQ
jgi:hypothetical protein